MTTRLPPTEPLGLFAAYAARRGCVWLDNATGGTSLMAAEPDLVVRAKGRQVEVTGRAMEDADVFAVLDQLLQQRRGQPGAVARLPFETTGLAPMTSM